MLHHIPFTSEMKFVGFLALLLTFIRLRLFLSTNFFGLRLVKAFCGIGSLYFHQLNHASYSQKPLQQVPQKAPSHHTSLIILFIKPLMTNDRGNDDISRHIFLIMFRVGSEAKNKALIGFSGRDRSHLILSSTSQQQGNRDWDDTKIDSLSEALGFQLILRIGNKP